MITLKPVVAFDCDDVLLDFMRALFTYLNLRLGRNYAYEDLVDYNLAALLSLPEEVKQGYVEEFYASAAFNELPPMEGAVEAVRELIIFCSPVVVTSRHPEHEPNTRANLARHYLNTFERMHLLGHYDAKVKPEDRENKGVICIRIGAIACVEDALGNARDIAAVGIPVIMPDRPWNRGPTPPLVTRVRGWPEVVAAVRDIINKNT